MREKKQENSISVWELQAQLNSQEILHKEPGTVPNDKWVPKAFQPDHQATLQENVAKDKSSGPMRTAVCDNRELRLICLLPDKTREVIKPRREGEILGMNGTTTGKNVFCSCHMVEEKHLYVVHRDTGWYASPMAANVTLKGRNINVGSQILLHDRDLLGMGDCELVVELF